MVCREGGTGSVGWRWEKGTLMVHFFFFLFFVLYLLLFLSSVDFSVFGWASWWDFSGSAGGLLAFFVFEKEKRRRDVMADRVGFEEYSPVS